MYRIRTFMFVKERIPQAAARTISCTLARDYTLYFGITTFMFRALRAVSSLGIQSGGWQPPRSKVCLCPSSNQDRNGFPKTTEAMALRSGYHREQAPFASETSASSSLS